MLSPRGYGRATADDLQPPRAALRDARAAPRSRSPPTSRSSRSVPGRSTSSRSRSSSRCCSPRCSPARCAPRPLLLARYYVLMNASLAAGLWDYLRHGTPPAGRPPRARGDPSRVRRRRVAALALVLSAPPCSPPRSRSGSSRAGPRSTASAASGCDGAQFDVLKLRTMVAGAEHDRRRARRRRGRRAHHARRRAAAPHLARRAAQPAERAARRDVADRPAPDAARAGRAVHRAPARPARGQARDHRLGAGQRPRLAAVVRAHRARPLLHRAPLAALDLRILARTPLLVLGGGGLYKGAAGGWEGEL